MLAEVKKDGKVITSSGQISAQTGKATFDGYIVNKDWAKANRDFMVKFVKVMADADAKYRTNKAKWTKDSPEVAAVAKWSGAKAEDVPGSIALYKFPTAKEQATTWLGGGSDSLAAKALAATAQFQLSQKQIEKTLPDYAVAVNPAYAAEAANDDGRLRMRPSTGGPHPDASRRTHGVAPPDTAAMPKSP